MHKALMTPEALSTYWEVPLATLSQWRWNGKGLTFTKLGRHIFYYRQDIEFFEEKSFANVQQLPC